MSCFLNGVWCRVAGLAGVTTLSAHKAVCVWAVMSVTHTESAQHFLLWGDSQGTRSHRCDLVNICKHPALYFWSLNSETFSLRAISRHASSGYLQCVVGDCDKTTVCLDSVGGVTPYNRTTCVFCLMNKEVFDVWIPVKPLIKYGLNIHLLQF